LGNVQTIVAIELLYAAQALDLRINLEGQKIDTTPEKLFGTGTAAAHRIIRSNVPFLERDRPIYLDIEKALALIKSEELLQAVEKVVGKLN
jgi:histidine ammonia-lyase